MASELELKAVITDPAAFRAALGAAGAVRRFRGRMDDRRLDRAGELVARDEVLRIRRWRPEATGPARAELAWKGPRSVDAAGYKHREELECEAGTPDELFRLFARLGYEVVHGMDRFVEVWTLGATTLRLEWYPRMDVLLEIEGDPAGIEVAIAAVGLDRAACTADALALFVERYAARTGATPALDEASLGGAIPGWVGA